MHKTAGELIDSGAGFVFQADFREQFAGSDPSIVKESEQVKNFRERQIVEVRGRLKLNAYALLHAIRVSLGVDSKNCGSS